MELSNSTSISQQSLAFFETLLAVLPAKSASDRTGYRRIAEWLGAGVRDGRFNGEIFGRVLLLAREAGAGFARNPRAVFMSNLRKELGYGK